MSTKAFFWVGLLFALLNVVMLTWNVIGHNWLLVSVSFVGLVGALVGLSANVESLVLEGRIDEMNRWSVR